MNKKILTKNKLKHKFVVQDIDDIWTLDFTVILKSKKYYYAFGHT